MTSVDRALLDQPTYIEKCNAANDMAFANAPRCAVCGYRYDQHSAGLMGTPLNRCPNYENDMWLSTTFKLNGLCEGSIPEYNDPTGENSKPCGSRFGTYRPEHEQVLCDGCKEGM